MYPMDEAGVLVRALHAHGNGRLGGSEELLIVVPFVVTMLSVFLAVLVQAVPAPVHHAEGPRLRRIDSWDYCRPA